MMQSAPEWPVDVFPAWVRDYCVTQVATAGFAPALALAALSTVLAGRFCVQDAGRDEDIGLFLVFAGDEHERDSTVWTTLENFLRESMEPCTRPGPAEVELRAECVRIGSDHGLARLLYEARDAWRWERSPWHHLRSDMLWSHGRVILWSKYGHRLADLVSGRTDPGHAHTADELRMYLRAHDGLPLGEAVAFPGVARPIMTLVAWCGESELVAEPSARAGSLWPMRAALLDRLLVTRTGRRAAVGGVEAQTAQDAERRFFDGLSHLLSHNEVLDGCSITPRVIAVAPEAHGVLASVPADERRLVVRLSGVLALADACDGHERLDDVRVSGSAARRAVELGAYFTAERAALACVRARPRPTEAPREPDLMAVHWFPELALSLTDGPVGRASALREFCAQLDVNELDAATRERLGQYLVRHVGGHDGPGGALACDICGHPVGGVQGVVFLAPAIDVCEWKTWSRTKIAHCNCVEQRYVEHHLAYPGAYRQIALGDVLATGAPDAGVLRTLYPPTDVPELMNYFALEVDIISRRLMLAGWVTPAPGVVYVVQQGADGPVKIGFTAGPVEKRLATLQTASPHPLRLIAVLPGDRSVEKALHRRFAAHRLAGEWFEPEPEVLALANQ